MIKKITKMFILVLLIFSSQTSNADEFIDLPIEVYNQNNEVIQEEYVIKYIYNSNGWLIELEEESFGRYEGIYYLYATSRYDNGLKTFPYLVELRANQNGELLPYNEDGKLINEPIKLFASYSEVVGRIISSDGYFIKSEDSVNEKLGQCNLLSYRNGLIIGDNIEIDENGNFSIDKIDVGEYELQFNLKTSIQKRVSSNINLEKDSRWDYLSISPSVNNSSSNNVLIPVAYDYKLKGHLKQYKDGTGFSLGSISFGFSPFVELYKTREGIEPEYIGRIDVDSNGDFYIDDAESYDSSFFQDLDKGDYYLEIINIDASDKDRRVSFSVDSDGEFSVTDVVIDVSTAQLHIKALVDEEEAYKNNYVELIITNKDDPKDVHLLELFFFNQYTSSFTFLNEGKYDIALVNRYQQSYSSEKIEFDVIKEDNELNVYHNGNLVTEDNPIIIDGKNYKTPIVYPIKIKVEDIEGKSVLESFENELKSEIERYQSNNQDIDTFNFYNYNTNNSTVVFHFNEASQNLINQYDIQKLIFSIGNTMLELNKDNMDELFNQYDGEITIEFEVLPQIKNILKNKNNYTLPIAELIIKQNSELIKELKYPILLGISKDILDTDDENQAIYYEEMLYEGMFYKTIGIDYSDANYYKKLKMEIGIFDNDQLTSLVDNKIGFFTMNFNANRSGTFYGRRTAPKFSDVESYQIDDIRSLYLRNIIKEDSNGLFNLDKDITRAEFALMLYKLAGEEPISEDMNFFSDINKNDWFSEAVNWASYHKYILGYDGEFRPENSISKQDVAVILKRFIDNEMPDINFKYLELKKLNDLNLCSDYALESVDLLSRSYVIYGDINNNLDPRGNASKYQVAHWISNILK